MLVFFQVFLTALHLRSNGANAIDSVSFKALPGCEKGFALHGNESTSLETRGTLDCARSCSLHPGCLGFNLCRGGTSGPDLCQLVTQWSQNSCQQLAPAAKCSYRAMDIPCVQGSVDNVTRKCVCHFGYAGHSCHRLFRDCKEGTEMGLTGDNFTTLLQPSGSPFPFVTRCNFDYGTTTIVWRRFWCAHGDAFLAGSWQSLRVQQGSCLDCCFAGLDNIYHLLHQGIRYTLSVYVMYNDWASDAKAYYPDIQMQNEAGLYALTYSGTPILTKSADDDFLPNRNRKFCTQDHDCSGCAAAAGHAGWFDDSGPGCKKVMGLGNPLLWSVSGSTQTLQQIIFELKRV